MYEHHQQQHHHQHHHHQHQQPSHINNNDGPHRYIAMNSQDNNDSHLGVASPNGRLHQPVAQHHQHSHQHQPDNLDSIDMENYSPELTAAENPFYYNKNKLLFDLHIERVRRTQQVNH